MIFKLTHFISFLLYLFKDFSWKRRLQYFTTINNSYLFDSDFYSDNARNSGIYNPFVHPVIHYILIGDKHKISTHIFFDTEYYYYTYNDFKSTDMTALYHYLRYGISELRNPHPFIDLGYIERQLDKTSKDPFSAFLDSQAGSINPHVAINSAHIAKQISNAEIQQRGILAELINDRSLTLDPSCKFDVSEYVKINEGDLHDKHPLYGYLMYCDSIFTCSFQSYKLSTKIESQINEVITSLFSEDSAVDISTLDKMRSIFLGSSFSLLLKEVLDRSAEDLDLIVFVDLEYLADNRGYISQILNAIHPESRNKNRFIFTSQREGVESQKKDTEISQIDTEFIDLSKYKIHININDMLRIIAIFTQLHRKCSILSICSVIGYGLIANYGRPISQSNKIFLAITEHELMNGSFCQEIDGIKRYIENIWIAKNDNNLESYISNRILLEDYLENNHIRFKYF